MMEPELESFEAELRKLRPAKPRGELMHRLVAENRASDGPRGLPKEQSPVEWAAILLRWFAPATAAAVIIGVIVVRNHYASKGSPRTVPPTTASAPLVAANDLEFDRQLVASFDAVAELPGGEPVRFNCRRWRDRVTYRDPIHDLVIERTIPRLEVIPVRMETY